MIAPTMHALLRLLAVACLVLVTAGPHVYAENDDAIRNPQRQVGTARNPFEWLFGNRQKPAPQTAPKATQRDYKPRTRTASQPVPRALPDYGPTIPGAPLPADPNQPQLADASSPTPATPSASLSFAVIGDSLSILLAQGLQDIYADRPTVRMLKKGRDSSGLVRDDYYDWPKALREIANGTERVDAVLVMMGSNDRQQLRDETGVHEPRSERWREIYAKRIDDIVAIARDKKLPLIWVGLPVMRAERFSADMLAFNEIFRARLQQAGVTYVDVWEAFSSDSGEYSATGPDVSGDVVRLRTSDGVHFTKAGARKLAFFADKELQKIVAAAVARSNVARSDVARISPADAPGTPGSSLPQIQSADGIVMIPSPPEPSLPPALRSLDSILGVALPDWPATVPLRPRPAFGPVLSLTAPPVSPGGTLLEPRGVKVGNEAVRVYVEGVPQRPKPGRADDFRVQ